MLYTFGDQMSTLSIVPDGYPVNSTRWAPCQFYLSQMFNAKSRTAVKIKNKFCSFN